MDESQKEALCANIAGGLSHANEGIQERMIEQFRQADPDYAERVAAKLEGICQSWYEFEIKVNDKAYSVPILQKTSIDSCSSACVGDLWLYNASASWAGGLFVFFKPFI